MASITNALFLSGFYFKIPYLLFKGDTPAISPYYGLSLYGPYELPPKPFKTILFLYPDSKNFEIIVNEVAKALENGYRRYFPNGFNKIFKLDIDIEKQKVEYNKYNLLDPDSTAEAYLETLKQVSRDISDCFPILMINKVPRGLYRSLYVSLKYRFTLEGLPSQIFTYETFSDREIFKWSIFPLALQIFVKMGGIPFLLRDRLKTPENESIIIIGIGVSRIHLMDKEVKYVGFALVFEASGRWRIIKWSSAPYIKGKLPQMIRKLIIDAVNDVVRSYAVKKPEKMHVIIHYSGKNIAVSEEGAIINACNKLKEIHKIPMIPYIVKIQPSIYRMFDENNLCFNSKGSSTYLVNVGTVIRLKEDLYLLHTTGCVKVQTARGIISRPNTHGSPSPLIVSIKRLEDINYELNDNELIKSVFYMCRMNYVSINNPISRFPVSTKYSRLLAQITLKLTLGLDEEKTEDINLLIPQELNRKLWFI